MFSFAKSFKKNKNNILINLSAIFLLLLILCLISNPAKYISSINKGLLIWFTSVLPSLFPFFFLTKILMNLNVVEKICKIFERITKFLFKASGISSYIFLMSIISGYPVGAKLIADCVENKIITSREANKLAGFCSTSGPMFVIGSVGVGMFVNSTVGIIIFLSHILGAIVNGVVFRKFYVDQNENSKQLKPKSVNYDILAESMTNSITSILIVGGYIAIFSMIIDMMIDFKVIQFFQIVFSPLINILNLTAGTSQAILTGFVEITRGCFELSKLNLNLTALSVIATGIITFGGISIFFQSITFLSKSKINVKYYLLQKITHTIFACVISWILCLIIL